MLQTDTLDQRKRFQPDFSELKQESVAHSAQTWSERRDQLLQQEIELSAPWLFRIHDMPKLLDMAFYPHDLF